MWGKVNLGDELAGMRGVVHGHQRRSLVPKGLDHGAIVWRCASRNNQALPKALFPILEWNVIMTSTYRGNAALGTRHFRTN
jgi:hypothetical protein